VAKAAAENGRWKPGDLSVELRREWVRYNARTHVELNADNRLATTMDFCDRLIQALAVSDWEIEKGAGGNWDDQALESITSRIGLQLHVSRDVYNGIKRPIREDKGPLALVKFLRNQLAHGDLSFSECGDGVTVADLRLIKERAELYLKEVVNMFNIFIRDYLFLIPERRPLAGGET
jgi:MAE_28990/MAE_18760-like HEPN